MNMIDKTQADITLGELLNGIAETPKLPLVFVYDDREIRPGYHVTEVKAGAFSALDCGANPEAWSEIFVQLWDIDEDGRNHIAAEKFSAIVRKVSEHVKLDGTAKLTFEVSNGVRPMELYCATLPQEVDGVLRVELSPRPASCKPRDRWLANASSAPECCSSSTKTTCCAA
jgi:hypothetical protein